MRERWRAIIDICVARDARRRSPRSTEIDTLFAHDSVEEIVTALAKHNSEFAQADARRRFLDKSPTGLKLTLKLLRWRANSSSLEECLAREYRRRAGIFVKHEFLKASAPP